MPEQDETVALRASGPVPTPGAKPVSKTAGFEPGQLLQDRYRIVALLGKGGMGEVYRADDLALGQSVALKFLPPGVDSERFRNEVKIGRQVSHPNVCRVYDFGEAEGRAFLSMEYVDGEDLGSLLRRIGRLPYDKALEISRKLCAGLAAAHDKGVLHRDLKPGNVMLDGRGQVLLTDFGLAALAGSVEGAEVLSGTPAYMAPEQLEGREVTVRSDIYSLGLVMYELFTGKRPYESDTLVGLTKARSSSAPASISSIARDVDPLVERVILRCLEPDASRRPSSAIGVAAALPGGDPLAAALAAGETPSPQMVAAAGEGRGLKVKWAVPVLMAVIAGLIVNSVAGSARVALERLRPEYSGEVLTVKARDILARLGYPERPADWESGFSSDEGQVGWIEKNERPKDWGEALRKRPDPLQFWYRQSARPMNGEEFHSDLLTPGIVTEGDPTLEDAGSIQVRLDSRGRLRAFTAIPKQREAPPAEARTADWAPLFAAAELDEAQFREAASEWSFLTPADERKAWTGKWPGTERALRVEAAAWRGKPVAFLLVSDWVRPWREPGQDSTAGMTRTLVIVGLTLLCLLGGGMLAWRQWKAGRVDRVGGLRLAVFAFAVLMAIWVCQVHLNLDPGVVGMGLIAIATAIGWSAVIWMWYVAVEPLIRRFWPQAIISWSSIAVGNWRDPVVGRDVLLGMAMGLSWRLFDRAVDYWGPQTPPGFVQMAVLEGFRPLMGALLTKVFYGIRSALVFFMMLFLVRLLVKREALAAVVFTVGMSALAASGSDNFWLSWAVNGAVYLLIALVGVRMGLLSLTVAMFTANVTLLTFALQPQAWYFPNALLAFAVLVGLAVWACRTATAQRTA